VQPPIRVAGERGGIEIDWDSAALPHAMIWLSDRQLSDAPWNGRYRGLGIEPIASAFDFPAAVSTAPNPLSEAGHRTWIDLDPARPLHLSHRISAFGTT
jgi:hypothetical protein